MRFRYLVGEVVDSLNRFWETNVRKDQSEVPERSAPEEQPAKPPAWSDPDLLGAAQLCTDLARLEDVRDAGPMLQEAARILDALGVIVWLWDPQAAELSPAVTHGYRIGCSRSCHASAATRTTPRRPRSGRRRRAWSRGAISPATRRRPAADAGGRAGVLAVELPHGCAQRESIRALVVILASQLAMMARAARSADQPIADFA